MNTRTHIIHSAAAGRLPSPRVSDPAGDRARASFDGYVADIHPTPTRPQPWNLQSKLGERLMT